MDEERNKIDIFIFKIQEMIILDMLKSNIFIFITIRFRG